MKRLRLSLRYRIALVIFVLEACMLATVLTVTLSQSRQTAVEFDAASQKASMDLLANLSVVALLNGEYTDYQLYLEDVRKQPTIDHIALADLSQRIVASSHVGDVGRPVSQLVPNTPGNWHVQTVETPAGPMGQLAVQFSDAAIVAAYRRTRNVAVIMALTGMSIIALIGLATGFALTRRLENVTDATRRFAEGDHGVRSAVRGRDEIAVLAANFNAMAEAVARQQQQLREQGEHIELLLDSAAEAIYGVDTQGICTFANPACLRMLGYTRESDLVGKPIHNLIHHTYPDGRPYPAHECAVRKSTREGQPVHAENEVHWRADGSSFPVEYWAHPMYRNDRLIGAVVTFVDISERKAAEAQLQRYRDNLEHMVEARTAELKAVNRELEAFSYSVSHDLRAPLRAVDGFSQALLEDYGGKLDAAGHDYLTRVRAGTQRMGELIDDLLNLARVTRAKLEPTRVNLSMMAQEIADRLREAEPEHHVDIEIQAGLTVIGDAGLLRTALDNLLGNAWKYSAKVAQPRIAFGRTDLGGSQVFFVRDNGAGFDMKYVDKLFRAFQRLHRQDEFEGTGIGLATVQRIVLRHGGRVWAESAIGQGATFYFTVNLRENSGDPRRT